MNWYNKVTKISDILSIVFVILMIIACIIGAINYNKKPIEKEIEKPTIRIDSIKKDNVELIIKINNLDSTKNVESIKVQSLDNDSTLKLFYELIRK